MTLHMSWMMSIPEASNVPLLSPHIIQTSSISTLEALKPNLVVFHCDENTDFHKNLTRHEQYVDNYTTIQAKTHLIGQGEGAIEPSMIFSLIEKIQEAPP